MSLSFNYVEHKKFSLLHKLSNSSTRRIMTVLYPTAYCFLSHVQGHLRNASEKCILELCALEFLSDSIDSVFLK